MADVLTDADIDKLPQTLTDADIDAHQAATGPPAPKSFMDHVTGALSEYGKDVSGAVTGTVKAAMDIPGFIQSWQQENSDIANRAIDAFRNGDTANGAIHLANLAMQIVPGTGAASEKMADALNRGDYDSAAGQALALLTIAKAPDAVSGIAPKVAAGFKAGAPDFAAGAAKAGAGAAVEAALPEGTPSGVKYGLGGALAYQGGSQMLRGVTAGLKAARETPMGPGLLDRLQALRDPPDVPPAPPQAEAAPLQSLSDYFTQKVKASAPTASNSPGIPSKDDEMLESPAGKAPLAMPALQSSPAGEFGAAVPAPAPPPAAWLDKTSSGLQVAPEILARTKVAQTLAKNLDAAGVTPQILDDLEKDPKAAKLFWDNISQTQGVSKQAKYSASPKTIEAAKDALQGIHDAKPVGTTPSLEDQARTAFRIRQMLTPGAPLPYAATQDAATAANLSQGARRTMPDGTTQVLKVVPIDRISGDPGNAIDETTVQKYQQNPSPIQPELRAGDDGGYVIQEGHHRILAQVRNGANQVLAWTPEPNLGPVKGAPVVFKPSPELMQRLQANGGRGGQAAADLANALTK